MKAARLYAAGDIRVEDIDIPGQLSADWVRVSVTAAGICGSDLHNFRTGQWITRSPSVAGHEFAGVVTEIGADVVALKVGDSVVADSRFWCGECAACRSGRHNICDHLGFVGEICDGGFAEQAVLPARLLVRHDPALDPAIAAMAEPLAVALHAVRRQKVPPGEPVLVIGCGPIGGLAALVLSRLHDGPVLVCDRNADRAKLVAQVTGASIVALDTAPLGDVLFGRRLRYALDATGQIEVLMQVIARLGGGGSLALVGISHGRIDLDPNILVEREIALIGCHAFGGELPEAVAMLAGLSDALTRLIDREIAIDDVPQAYERLVGGKAAGLKTIVRFTRNEDGQ